MTGSGINSYQSTVAYTYSEGQQASIEQEHCTYMQTQPPKCSKEQSKPIILSEPEVRDLKYV